MRTFSKKEKEYLHRLRIRNYLDCDNWNATLDSPMNALEKKLRKGIADKCDLFMAELALAEAAGVLPTDAMKAEGSSTVEDALRQFRIAHAFEQVRLERMNMPRQY